MTNSAIALHTIEQEPRILDTDLAERLGFDRPRVVRELIMRNADELAALGSLAVSHGKSRGQAFTAYYLNEEQALLICMFSRTEKAAAVRKQVIDTFIAVRRGKEPVTILSIPNFANPAEAARAWAAEFEAKQIAEQKLEEAKPQLAIAERVVSHNHNLSRFIRTLDGINQNAIKKDLMRLGYFYKQGGTYRVYAKHRNVFTEKALAEFGSVDIFPTAEGKALLVQLYEAGKLTMRKGCVVGRA